MRLKNIYIFLITDVKKQGFCKIFIRHVYMMLVEKRLKILSARMHSLDVPGKVFSL